MRIERYSVFMQIRCNFSDISYLSETQKNTFQFLSERWKMEKGIQKAKININILVFCMQYNWPPFRCIQNLKTQAQRTAEKSITETLV